MFLGSQAYPSGLWLRAEVIVGTPEEEVKIKVEAIRGELREEFIFAIPEAAARAVLAASELQVAMRELFPPAAEDGYCGDDYDPGMHWQPG